MRVNKHAQKTNFTRDFYELIRSVGRSFTSKLHNTDKKAMRRASFLYGGLSLFCIAFLLLFSASTSPLYTDYCDGDSSIFLLIGKAIASGKNAYTDLFDHKGPILFYINALGYAVTGSKTGVFILQCINLSFTAAFMYKTARLFTGGVRSLICTLISVLAFASTISDGNLSEEYCLLLCVVPMYFALKHITTLPDAPHPGKYMLVYGICLALCAFIRINNGIMICGIVLIAIITDFTNENIKQAVFNIIVFIIGIMIVAVPVCLFFLCKGTLSEMLFSTFAFNLLYATAGASDKTAVALLELIAWIIPALILIIMPPILAKRFKPKTASLITTLSVFALIPLLLGFSYTHYYTSLIPLIPLYCAVFFYIAGDKLRLGAVLICAVSLLPLAGYFVSLPSNIHIYTTLAERQLNPGKHLKPHADFYYSAQELTSYIPADERDSVFGYDVSAAWFLQAGITPCFKIFTLQESWAAHYPEFGRQINEMMLTSPPKWVVIHNIDIIESRQFLNIINTGYTQIAQHGYDLLYRRKD